MGERKCPFVPRQNPIECPICSSTEVNAEPAGGTTIIHCDDCGYHGVPEPVSPEGDKDDSQGWDPTRILKSLGLYPKKENP